MMDMEQVEEVISSFVNSTQRGFIENIKELCTFVDDKDKEFLIEHITNMEGVSGVCTNEVSQKVLASDLVDVLYWDHDAWEDRFDQSPFKTQEIEGTKASLVDWDEVAKKLDLKEGRTYTEVLVHISLPNLAYISLERKEPQLRFHYEHKSREIRLHPKHDDIEDTPIESVLGSFIVKASSVMDQIKVRLALQLWAYLKMKEGEKS